MRERTTWNKDAIRTAAMNRTADPYTMNQDHVGQQPAADAYVTGTPSDFAEDVTSPNRWEEEYKGGVVKRDEIGMPEMRGETFNHPEKTAAVLLKKAELCATVAKMMLGKMASEDAVESQAFGLMYMPDAELINTFDRLSADSQQLPVQAEQLPVQAEQPIQAVAPQIAADQLAQVVQQAVQQALQQQACKMATEEKKEGQDEPKEAQGEQKQAKDAEQEPKDEPKDEPKEGQQKQAEQQLNIEAMVQNMVQQALQQQSQQVQQPAPQQPAPQQGGQQQAAQPMQEQADDMLLDEMLMAPDELPMDNGMGIELEPSPMDVGEVVLGPEDEALRTLFANQETQDAEEAQQAQQGQQQKQAMTRTASTRTVGTRPTHGVSRVGGGASPNQAGAVDKLANLWQSAPDVSEAFGMKRG